MNLETDVFHTFFPGNALLTAGDQNDYNTMLIGWGSLGTIWGKDAVTVYVRDSRYTLEYLKKNDYFTVAFFDDHQDDLRILGTRSGRDGDKVALTSLTPMQTPHSMSFKEAKYTLVCRKLYLQHMDVAAMSADIAAKRYDDGDIHNIVIGEVTDLIK